MKKEFADIGVFDLFVGKLMVVEEPLNALDAYFAWFDACFAMDATQQLPQFPAQGRVEVVFDDVVSPPR